MKIGREIVALRKFTYSGDANPEPVFLRGVYIDGENGEAYATDGAIAVVVPLEEKDPAFKAILPADALARIPEGVTYPINLALLGDGQEVRASFRLDGIEMTMQFKTIPGKFPNVRGIMPKAGERPVKSVFNAEYLRAFFDLAARHNRGSLKPVSVEFEAGKQLTEAARLTFLLPDGRRVECAAAQVRVFGKEVATMEEDRPDEAPEKPGETPAPGAEEPKPAPTSETPTDEPSA